MVSQLSAQTNVVNNGGFEQAIYIDQTQPQEWVKDTGTGQLEGLYTVGTTNDIVPPEGTKMCYVRCNTDVTYTSAILKKPANGSGVTLTSGNKYVLTFKVYSIAGGANVPKMALKLALIGNGGTLLINPTTYFNVSSGSWQTFTYTFTATSNAADGTTLPAQVAIFLLGNEANTIFYFDDFRINELINTSTSILTGFSYTFGTGPSSEQSFLVNATNLTSNLTLTPSANYEISTGTASSFIAANPIILSQSGGMVANTPIYVRLKAGLSVNSYSAENIVCSSTGASSKNVGCSGSVVTPIDTINNGGFELPLWVDQTQPQEWVGADKSEMEGFLITSSGNGVVPTEGAKMCYLKCTKAVTYSSAILSKPANGSGVTLTSGNKYVLTFKAYSIAGGANVPKMALKLALIGNGGTLLINPATYFNVPSGSWQTYSYTFTATSTATAGTELPAQVGIFLKGNEANTIFYFDDFKIEGLINTSTSALMGFTYTLGTGPSSERPFTVSAKNLTTNLTITPPADYEISTGTGTSFLATNPITLTPSGGTVTNTIIYVRQKAGLSVNNYNAEKIVCASATTGAASKNVVCSGSVNAPTYTLVFQDDFDSINTANWNLYNGPGHASNGLRSPAQFSVNNGVLFCTAEMINGVLNSGGMANKSNFTYGRFESRVLCESDPSAVMSGVVLTWPESNSKPIDGELDFYETVTTLRTPTSGWKSFIHFPNNTNDRASSYIHSGNPLIWHTVAMDWTPSEIRFYDDGVLVWTDTNSDHIPNVPHHLCIQYDAFGTYISAPSSLKVDWVKIYSIDGISAPFNTKMTTITAPILTNPVVTITNPVDKIGKILNGNFRTAQVFNLAGKMLLNSKIDSKNEIDFSTLASGCYIVKLIGKTQKSLKVIKK